MGRKISCTLILITAVLSFSCRYTQNIPVSINNTPPKAAVSYPFGLPDTGQITGYTDTYGEDSDFTINALSYTVNNDGTVTDNVTGLMWQQADAGEMTCEKALLYCEALHLGEYDDWRLPTAQELFSINDLGAINPALEIKKAFTEDYEELYGADYIRELYWWSSDPRADTDLRAWVTNAGGGIGAHIKSETASAAPGKVGRDGRVRYFHVRAVRTVVIPHIPATHFTNNGNGTVTDNYTGLVWLSALSRDTYTWEEALACVNALNAAGGYAGMTDWRLPNIRELFSLVDVTKMAPCIDSSVFDFTTLSPYAKPATHEAPGAVWSSTSMFRSPPGVSQAWDLHDISSGIVSYSQKKAAERIIFVRGGY
ncbi:DUF1566 domain-containing protein [Desulforhopalus vacuolatus]|uniref:Lcl C-terminal domain-containing protein n=1 Tax=Desulforhopalus vacuolatus TaxID=40414 RepID=UPI00196340FD|nr:DUF1566 domain-containing protein [Desulforhopalus vacuolatus]MBM9518948.1 DUF1566 domain-containing protein [Desulforhopalus vacuolatus]